MADAFSQHVPDGGAWRTLESGLVIIRRIKHEPPSAWPQERQALVAATDKVSGSKFLPAWPAGRVTDLVAHLVTAWA